MSSLPIDDAETSKEAKVLVEVNDASPQALIGVEIPEILELTASLQRTRIQGNSFSNLVSTSAGVTELVETLADLPVHSPSMFVDLEGVYLSRHGTISILQIFVLPRNQTYLVDIHALNEKAFSQATRNGRTLRGILESPSIPKVFFDVRNDSDALYSHFRIKLAGVQDIQLMELATRSFPKRRVNGLARCIENDAPMTNAERQNWKAGKEKGLDLFAPERGGSYEVFNIRPLSEDIVQYCVQDVKFLPNLWEKYSRKLTPRWATKVELEVKNRILQSQSATYNGKGKHMALAPKGWA